MIVDPLPAPGLADRRSERRSCRIDLRPEFIGRFDGAIGAVPLHGLDIDDVVAARRAAGLPGSATDMSEGLSDEAIGASTRPRAVDRALSDATLPGATTMAF